jgi:hypothetical protein
MLDARLAMAAAVLSVFAMTRVGCLCCLYVLFYRILEEAG